MKVRIRKSSFITLKKKYLFFSFFIILSFIGYTQSTNLLFNHLNKEKVSLKAFVMASSRIQEDSYGSPHIVAYIGTMGLNLSMSPRIILH